ncbi:MAG TPA: carboxypeptidase-like regulatory domain-containing protein [Vicinamibacterales bacterium]|nr:carboxypeptidase-like regulatory domain-containing protein [Vicinamibacterales bacterium]
MQDSAGGVIPGASVVVKSNATGTTFEAMTNSSGAFNVPSLSAGVYTVTVSLQGFKTSIITDVRVQSGIPTTINAALTVGGVSETVTVTGASAALINTRTATVASTLNVDQIAQIPSPTRDLLMGGVTFLVGVNQEGVARGQATINGLPESFLNIMLDGVSNQDTFNKSTDGFFAPVRPRQDAIEAVTVTTAVGGVEVGGSGATSINFVTRQGTNRFTGSVYEYYRDTWMNTNYWFNKRDGLGKNDVQLNQYGARVGGPIVLPKVWDGRGKAFFFVHHEELRLPNNASRDRDVLHPNALLGDFRYTTSAGVQTVNVLDLARRNNQISTPDPLAMSLLTRIQDATRKSGTLAAQTDPLLQEYSWLSPAMQTEHQPAIRIDFNINASNRLSGTFNKLWQDRDPDQLNGFDQRFPDTPNFGHTVARRPQRSIALRSTVSADLVSELRVGITRGERIFFGQTLGGGPDSFTDQNGYAVDLASDIALTNWHTRNTLSGRSAYQYTFDETLNWQKGKHTLTFGGGAFLGRAWDDSQQQVTALQLGFDNDNDPARSMFTAASGNFPGASGGQLTDARALYGLLTGRVASVGGIATLNENTEQYELLGRRRRAGKLNNYHVFLQDSWQMTPTVTITGGLRWDVQTPFSPTHDVMSATTLVDACGVSGLGDGGTFTSCNFFQPGASGGKAVPEFVQFTSGTRGYNTDWNNVSPSIGVAWRPQVESGFLRKILGDPEQATIRGGYSIAYERQGFGVFTGLYGPLPGSTLTLTRNSQTVAAGALLPAPVLLSETGRLFQAPFPETATYPIPARPQRLDSLSLFHPDIEIASARTWTVGLQRALSRNMAVEVRYVGTRGVNQWATINYNERNLIENGFLNEFKLAMANLAANNASGITGRVGSFAYFGDNSGTRPLPIYLAYISGRTNFNDPLAYNSTNWSNTDFTNDLVRTNPAPGNSAADLDGNNGRRNNAIAAGYAANFFVVNPAVANVNVTDSGAFSDYHALQVEVRRRLSRGLSVNANYQYAVEGSSSFQGLHFGRVMIPEDNVRHAIKMQWNWSIPVGRGYRFGTDMHPILNGILGNWDFTGAARIQARTLDFGNVRLVGMTAKDLQDLYSFRIIDDPNPDNPGRKLVTMLPEDVILNTRRAFETSTTTPTGYSDLGVPEGRYIAPASSEGCIQLRAGDCAPRTLLIRAPFFTRFDIGLTKRFPLRGSANFELRIDVLNLFDNINFNPVADPGDNDDIFQVGSGYSDPDNNFDPGGRLGQLSFRINW